MSRNLGNKQRISYYEPGEPPTDRYIYCERCMDYVYEYCSVHGALYVIPDDKLKKKQHYSVPPAALTIPHVFLHLAPSTIPGAGIGVFSTLTLPRGVRFGPYKGEKSFTVSSDYCWQIYTKTRPSHVVDGSDTSKSNWMRYVNCARHSMEQNLVAYQYDGQIYYRTIKIIPRYTELLVFYGSEFAHFFNVDLRRYNSPAGYIPILLGTRKSNNKMKPENTIQDVAPNEASCKNQNKYNEVEEDFNMELEHIAEKSTVEESFDEENNKTASKFICDDCDYTTEDKELLNKHKQASIFKCNKCRLETSNHSFFRKHYMLHDETRPFVCDLCSHRFTHAHKLKRHLTCHSSVAGQENNCAQLNNQNWKKKEEKQRGTSNNKMKPENTIQDVAPNDPSCKNHNKYNEVEEDYSMELVHIAAKSAVEENVDEKNNETAPKFICDDCAYTTQDKELLNKHIQASMFKCNKCRFETSVHSYFRRHYMLHDETRPFVCDLCSHRFTHAYNLRRHSKCHSKIDREENNSASSENYKIGTVDKNLKPEVPMFKCEKCSFKTHIHSFFEKHHGLHDEKRNFICDACGYRFKNTRGLINHIKSHLRGKKGSGRINKLPRE